ncbi:MAG: SDR family oxidoreductase [Myxococcales bacterium]|nr:SDR family oxidoreductase [Myxococcales bacterium]MDP3499800.1 SDR family oxidoreductase [Myxococcales bacterium]
MGPRRLFIAGATGAVGKVLIPMADRHALPVVPHVRPKSASSLSHPNVVAIDLADAGLSAAMQGCTTVVQLIGTMKNRFAKGDTYETSDIGTTRQLVEAAKRAGVDHLVLLSSVLAGHPIGAYLEAKAKAEALVRESGLGFTIFRPAAFEDRGGDSMPVARAFTSFFGLTRYQPITLAELASALLHVAKERAPLGVALEGKTLWDVVQAASALR